MRRLVNDVSFEGPFIVQVLYGHRAVLYTSPSCASTSKQNKINTLTRILSKALL